MYFTTTPPAQENNTSKFSARYRGPYRVEEAVTDNRVRLKSLRTGKVIPHLVNINKLKRAYCREEDQEEEIVEESGGTRGRGGRKSRERGKPTKELLWRGFGTKAI